MKSSSPAAAKAPAKAPATAAAIIAILGASAGAAVSHGAEANNASPAAIMKPPCSDAFSRCSPS